LDSAGIERTREVWQQLPRARRQETMRLLGDQANEHIELNFDKLALLGLLDDDPHVRQLAVANLWECEDPSLTGKLLRLLAADLDADVRAESARALGRFVYRCEVADVEDEEKRTLEANLLAAAAAPEQDLRLRSLEALGFSSRPEVPPLIQAAYGSSDEESKRSAILAMGRSGDPRWREPVIAEMRSASPEMRREAAQAAGELELRQSVPELLELLEDANLDVQRQAIWALGQIGGKLAERGLRRLLRSAPDAEIAGEAEESLEHLAFVDSTRQLEEGLRVRDEGG